FAGRDVLLELQRLHGPGHGQVGVGGNQYVSTRRQLRQVVEGKRRERSHSRKAEQFRVRVVLWSDEKNDSFRHRLAEPSDQIQIRPPINNTPVENERPAELAQFV